MSDQPTRDQLVEQAARAIFLRQLRDRQEVTVTYPGWEEDAWRNEPADGQAEYRADARALVDAVLLHNHDECLEINRGWQEYKRRKQVERAKLTAERDAAGQRAASWWEAAKHFSREQRRARWDWIVLTGKTAKWKERADAAEAKLDQMRGWLDMEEASTREWDGKHNPECECEVAQTTYEIVANVRKILDEVQR